jgi:serine/threonine protein phosphatase PrpC
MYEIDVQEGDVIIVGSDGLFDNVYDKDIENLVTPICNSEMKDAQGIGIRGLLKFLDILK